jgi:hypothetical protein
MNQTLSKAISEITALSEADQDEIALDMLDLAARKRIDVMLRESEERGGEKPHDVFMAELRSRYAN